MLVLTPGPRSRELCRHTEWRLRRSGRHFGVNLAEFFGARNDGRSLVAGFAPAGGVDITARLIGQWLSERLGQQFVIENRPGASSNIATETVVRATADGYTL